MANLRIEYQIKEVGTVDAMSKPSVVRAHRRRGIKVAPEVLRAGGKAGGTPFVVYILRHFLSN